MKYYLNLVAYKEPFQKIVKIGGNVYKKKWLILVLAQ